MSKENSLIAEASAFVYTLFKEKLPEGILFHSYEHTVDVVDAAAKIGAKSDLKESQQQLVQLAAWFHDTGFTRTYEGHEEAGVSIAAGFMEAYEMSDEEIAEVAALIRATKPDHPPQTVAEAVIRDADLSHVGRKKFFENAERLRLEWQNMLGRTYTDREWAELQLEFLKSVRFSTPFARKRYGERLASNLRELQRSLGEMMVEERKPAEKKKAPGRGVETMYRTTYRNHINLSSIADSKANIMISVNAILMSIIISFVSTRLQMNPWLLAPAGCLLVTSLIAIVFAILSARPKVTSQTFTLEDVRQNRSNILFFGNFTRMALPDFNVGMREIMEDADRLYDNMISDIYSLGQVLSKKYRLLWISYTVFMAGLSLSVILFLILFFAS